MRILNRPMFKYGGPIKEGVMHGMRDGGRTIAGGHQIGMPMGNRTGFADPTTNPGYWRTLLEASKKLFSPLGKIKKIKKVADKGIPKNLQGIFTQTGTSPGITGTGAGSAWMAGPSKYLEHLKKVTPMAKNLWGKHRYKTIAGGLGLTSAPAIGTYKWLADKAPEVIKGVTPDWIENIFTGKEEIDKKDGTDTITEKIEAIGPGAQFEDTAPIITDSMREKLAKDAQNKRLKSYLDMMGYDSAKKGALSDALIDASALVQDATTEAGSLKKADWGNLINKMIQTTSQRLDKPEQIREAVGLMMTKGEIEKDIAKGKENALDQQVSTLMNNLGYDKATATRVAKGLPKDLREQVIVDMGTSKQALTHSSLTSSVKKWYPQAIALLDTTEVKKQLGNQSAEEFITEKIKTNPTTNKIYIVGKEVVMVDGQGNASTIFP